jgi:hypothetical protein
LRSKNEEIFNQLEQVFRSLVDTINDQCQAGTPIAICKGASGTCGGRASSWCVLDELIVKAFLSIPREVSSAGR